MTAALAWPSPDEVHARTEDIARLLTGHRFRFSKERDIQDGIAGILEAKQWPHQRELSLSRPDRPDFMAEPGIAVEVKIKGTLSEALRQIARYAKHPEVRAVLLIGTPYWIARIPPEMEGKPLYGARLLSSLL